MSDSVVTELVIDTDTSGADQFSQSMEKANSSAEQGLGTIASLSLAVAGAGAAFIGSLAALHGFVDYVGGVNAQLIAIATNAENAGMSTKDFQETLFAAKSAGLSDKDFVSGLDKISADLTAAGRSVTDFGKLFQANGLSIKDASGDIKTAAQGLTDLENLMKNAPTPQVANAIASIAGISKDWVGFLKQGTDEIETQKKAAADLGVIIDDSTIQKANDFNDKWHTAIATWDLQFKASLAGILPLLVQTATLASKIIDTFSGVGGSLSALMTPDDEKSKQQLNYVADYVTELIALQTKWGDSSSGIAGQKINNLQSLIGIPEGSSIGQAIAYLDKLNALYDKPTRVIITSPATGDGSTVLPGVGKDAFAHTSDSIEKYIQLTDAASLSVDAGAYEQEKLKAVAQLTAAGLKDGLAPAAAAAKAEMSDLGDKAGAAALQLAKAKVEAQINFGGSTAFLSQGDVAIATQLKGLYPSVAEGLNSVEASQLRFIAGAKELTSGIETDLVTGLTNIADGSVRAGQGFQTMGLAIVKTLEQMLIKLLVVGPLMKALQDSIGGPIGSAFGITGVGSYGQASNATGLGAGTGGIPFPMFASGTASAPGGWSIVGENGPELMKIPAGTQVLPHGQSPSNDNGGGRQIINVYAAPNTQTQTKTSKDSSGNNVTDIIHTAVDQKMASGGFDKTLASRYGLTPQARSR